MSELKTRVDELKMENEYQLRLKDMTYGEKIKELTDKFLQEIEALKAKSEVRSITCKHDTQTELKLHLRSTLDYTLVYTCTWLSAMA